MTAIANAKLGFDLLFTDATYDIGKAGATRPRDGFFSRHVVIGGDLVLTSATVVRNSAGILYLRAFDGTAVNINDVSNGGVNIAAGGGTTSIGASATITNAGAMAGFTTGAFSSTITTTVASGSNAFVMGPGARFYYDGGADTFSAESAADKITHYTNGVERASFDASATASHSAMLLYIVDTGTVQRVQSITNGAILTLLGLGAGRLLYVPA